MKIQGTLPQHINTENKKEKQNVRFTGGFEAFSTALRFLDTNQAWGANAVDLGSMVIPRTTVDFVNRGPAAGAETGRRESAGTINHSLIGVYGSAAGLAFATLLNKDYGIRADKIFADNETVDIVGTAFHKQIHNGSKNPLEDALKETFSNLSTTVDGIEKRLDNNQVDNVVKRTITALNSKDIDSRTITDSTKKYLVNYINQALGSESDYKLAAPSKETTTSLSTFVENVYNLSKAFTEESVVKAFKAAKDFDKNEFINRFKSMNKNRTIAGMAIASGVGMTIQPLNIYLTKKKTGSDGFVGVEGREKDNSANFKLMKVLASAIFGGGIVGSLAMQEGGLLKNIQFKGMIPTINQFKLIYGLTIMSRFMVARDKDELRESVVKDVLGFLNWLVLGNFVAKGVVLALDKNKELLKDKNGGWNNFFKTKLKTRDEVLLAGLKKSGIDAVENGKALSFSKMLKKLPANELGKSVRKNLRILNIAQVAGYLYSGLVLGVGIPKLNIYMTNKSEAKRQAMLAQKRSQMSDNERMLSSQNIEFLKKQNTVSNMSA